MREIKFRVWDKNAKVIWIPEKILNDNFKDKIRTENDIIILMQFTGLKDKKGKEIYEGDILKADSSYHSWGHPKDDWFYGEVKFDSTMGYYCVFEKTNRTDIDEVHIEVIGNIYENPELIIGKNLKN